MKRSTRNPRRGFGAATQVHEVTGSERLNTATRFYADANNSATKGHCTNAVHSFAMGMNYEGEASAHLWDGKSLKTRPALLTQVMEMRDHTEALVMMACVRKPPRKRR